MRSSESPPGLHGRRRSQEGALLGAPRAALACSELTSSPPPLRTEKLMQRDQRGRAFRTSFPAPRDPGGVFHRSWVNTPGTREKRPRPGSGCTIPCRWV